MKRAYIFMLSLLLMIGIVIVASFAWFTNSEFVEPDLSGFSISAYFGGGDGSSEDPYQIKNPRHLYNLAWLQYLGYFNKPGTGNTPAKNPDETVTTLTQFNFVITEDLTMTGWALPPIGTAENPFIGLLNGNGHKIINLRTTNEYIDFGNRHPNSVTNSSFVKPEIIGFIGAIGKTDTMLNGGYSISSTENAVANIKLTNTVVFTSTTKTLAGIAAGYINGKVEDVGIVGGTLDIANSCTTKIKEDYSSYTVAGYAEENFVVKTNRTNAIVLNPTGTTKTKYVYEDSGDVTGWGGSIDMYSMYKNVILPKWNSSYANSLFHNYYTTKTITIDSNGNQTITYGPNPPTQHEVMDLGDTFGYHEYTYESSYINDDDTNKKIASYSFFYRENNDSYMYIAGNENRTISNAVTVTTVYENAFYISKSNNYLSRSNYNITNVTNASNASIWYYNGDEIYTLNGTTKYYLNDDNGTLNISQVSLTSWTKTNDTIQSDSNNYLIFDTSWKLASDNIIHNYGYKIYYVYNNGKTEINYYLNASTSGISAGTDPNSATLWEIDTNNNNRLSTVINGTRYYFVYTSWSSGTLGVATSPGSYYIIYQNNYLRYYNTNSYFIYCPGSWQESRTAYTINNVLVDEQTVNETTTSTVPDKISYEDTSYTTKIMYIPLQFGEDVNGDDGVSIKNTGYLIGGSYRGGSQPSDIRVSKYGITNINRSYTTSSGLGTIYTINGNNSHVNITDTIVSDSKWTKYDASKNSLQEILKKDSSYVYGLHFMESTISKNHTITADWVSINGSQYIQNYELPEDCIDFNLKEKGKVNFFAGTYYDGNNSFFSYNEVQRDSNNNITDIKQISEIYTDNNDTHSYVYKYSDGKYSVPYVIENNNGIITKKTLSGGTYTEYSTQNSLPSGYTSIFKTSWIGKQSSTYTTRRIYYFEIPTNDGEYALGSVKDGKGAYLLYLDIGANAQEINRTEINQKTSIIEKCYVFPKGIAVILESTTIDTTIGQESLNPSESAVTRKNSNGSLVLTRDTENTISANGSTVDSTYIPRTITLTNNSSAITAASVKTTTSIYSQIQYIDHNLTTNAIYETNIQRITVKNEQGVVQSTTDSYNIRNYSTRELIDTTSNKPAWRLYAVSNSKNVIVDFTSGSDSNATAIKTKLETIANSTGTTLLDYNYDTLDGSINTFDILIKMVINSSDNTGKYYIYNGNDIEVTTTNNGGSTIYVTVVESKDSLNNDITFKIKGDTVSQVGTITLTQTTS